MYTLLNELSNRSRSESLMKKRKLFKRMVIIGLSITGIVTAITTFIGNYFINYALLPKKDALGERKVTSDSLPDGVEEMDLDTKQLIQLNQEKTMELANEWLEQIFLHAEEVSVQSMDGLTLKGHVYYQETASDNWAVLVHGYQMSETEMTSTAEAYYKHGYNVLTFNHRGIKPSEGKYITMGIKEQHDLISWLEYLVERHPEAKIVTHGHSMGAATVLLASGLKNHPKEVVAVVADSAYTSVWNIFTSELDQRFKLPAFPILHMTGAIASPRTAINIFKDGNVVKQVEQSKTPTLFIHGTADGFVPFPMVHELYNAHPLKEKELFIVEGAGHVESKYVEPEKYNKAVFEFLEGKL